MGAVSSILRKSATEPAAKGLQQSTRQRTAAAAPAAAGKAAPAASKPTQSLKTEQLSTSAVADEQMVKENEKKKKTLAEADAELREKMAGLRGDGGDAGLELEGGQPVAMKRGVKNNMFRYI